MNYYVSKIYETLRMFTKFCETLRVENVRNITNVKHYVSKIYETLRTFTKYYSSKTFISKTYEILRTFTKYYVCAILRWVWKLTKFFRAKNYARFRTEKFPDACACGTILYQQWLNLNFYQRE